MNEMYYILKNFLTCSQFNENKMKIKSLIDATFSNQNLTIRFSIKVNKMIVDCLSCLYSSCLLFLVLTFVKLKYKPSSIKIMPLSSRLFCLSSDKRMIILKWNVFKYFSQTRHAGIHIFPRHRYPDEYLIARRFVTIMNT